jgi:hypothetical protein
MNLIPPKFEPLESVIIGVSNKSVPTESYEYLSNSFTQINSLNAGFYTYSGGIL